MSEKRSAHAERHGTKTPDADDVKIQFSPEVVRDFVRLEALVHGSPQFEFVQENLQELASGKPVPLPIALSHVARIAEHSVRHAQATGDAHVEGALDGLQEHLRGYGESKPFTVVLPKTRTR